ncbi:MAG: hypothetical protein ACLR1V_12130 [Coprococcus sp.]
MAGFDTNSKIDAFEHRRTNDIYFIAVATRKPEFSDGSWLGHIHASRSVEAVTKMSLNETSDALFMFAGAFCLLRRCGDIGIYRFKTYQFKK